MISASSSEYFSGPFQFSTLPNILGNPFCPAARQPLIYYAKIDEPFHQQQNGGKRKDKSNYFMKAFRWYTQEHGSCLGNENPASQVSQNGFAAWLDKKYSEYLKGNHQEKFDLVDKQPSTMETDTIPKKKKSSRKIGRLRSPWRKRHKLDSKEIGVIPLSNPHQSFQYILQPQDLSRTASECGRRSSRAQSATTVMSEECMKVKIKSKSLISLYKARDDRRNKDVTPMCHKKDVGTQYDTYSLETLMTKPSRKKKDSRIREFEDTNMTNVYTEKVDLKSVSCQCQKLNMKPDVYVLPNNFHGQQDEQNKKCTKDTLLDETLVDRTISKLPKTAVMFTRNANMETTKLQNLSIQTSDHSLNLDNMMHEKPILVRVIRLNQ